MRNEPLSQKATKPSWSYVWSSMSSFRKKFVLLLSIVLVDTVLTFLGIGMILPIFQSILSVDIEDQSLTRIYPGFAALSPESRLVVLSTFMGLLVIVKSTFNILNFAYSRHLAELMRAHWCDRIGQNIMYGTYVEFIKKEPGAILNNWLIEPLTAARFITTYISYLSSFMLTSLLVLLGLMVNWEVMVAFLGVSFFFVLLIQKYFYGTAVEHSRFKSAYNQELSASMSESLDHLKDIKILAVELERISLTLGVLGKIKSLFIRMTIFQNLPRVLGEMFAVLALVSLLFLSTTIDGLDLVEVLPVMIFFFVAWYKLITAGTQTITAKIKAWQDFNSLRIVTDMSRIRPDDDRLLQTNNHPIETLESDIVFNDVSFSYEKDLSLFNHFSLTIPKGKNTFIGGKSGSGKSTVLDLLLRIVAPERGEICVNGRNINEYDLTMWRNLFGYVSQDAALFHGTILQNIMLGCNSASTEEALKVCEISGCMDFIDELPEGLDTLVGDRGYTLSGGQRKRIAIARALIRKPSVIILDEATSSFEAEIERDIISRLRLENHDLTIIQTSHRPGSELHADIAIDLDDRATSEVRT